MPGAAERGDVALVWLLEHGHDIGMVGERSDVRHAEDGPEPSRQLHLLLGCQMLVAHENHRVVGERFGHDCHRLG